MNEWGVVGVIVALIGLIGAVLRPIISLNTAITRLTTLLEGLSDEMAQLTSKNSQTHERLFAYNGTQDKQLGDHERRISVLEIKDK